MSAGLVGLVLMAALFHASWNVLVKGGPDRLVTLALMQGSAGLLAAACLPFVPVPGAAAAPYLAAAVGVHFTAFLLLLAAYRHGDLSVVYPIARGTGVLWTVAGAAVWVGERTQGVAVGAVGLIAVGVLALAVPSNRSAPTSPRALAFALAAGVAVSAYTLLDGVGVRRAGSVESYTVWLFAFNGLTLPTLAAVVRRRTLGEAVRARWREGLGGGLLSVTSYGLALVAMRAAPLGPVAALRETSVLFAAVLGAAVLKEPLGWRRALAAVAVAAGVVLLRL